MRGAESDSVIANPLRANGLVDAGKLEEARAYQAKHGGLLSDALLRLSLLSEGDFLRTFAELYSTRFVKADKLRGIRIDDRLLERTGVRMAERLRMCPIRWDEETLELHVVAAVPLASNLEPELRKAFGARVITVYVSTTASLAALIRRYFYREEDAFSRVTDNGAGPGLMTLRDTQDDETREPTQSSSVIVPEELRDRTMIAAEPPREPTLTEAPLQPGKEEAPREKTVMVRYSDEAATIATLRRENARYRVAQEFHRRVTLERSLEAMVDRILSVIFELLPAEGVAIWLSTGQYASKVKAGAAKLEVPRAMIEQAQASPSGILTHNALIDERFDRSKSVVSRGIQSAMAVPLRTPRSQSIGVLYVESISQMAAFTEEDLPLLDSIGSQASMLLENAALLAQVKREVENRVSLSRFLSPAAVEEVLSGRMKLRMEGSNAEVTVLFADIRGFTTLSSQMPAEDVVRFLNQFFTEVVDSIEKHGGIVDKFIGDAVMGIWGAPEVREDDARNAVNAALEMTERSQRVSVSGQPLQLGVGVNSGPAVVGAIGSRQRLDYTAIGATVNLAARLCSIADGGQVLITSDTLLRAGPGVVSEALEPVFLKGLEVPIVPYSVKQVSQPLRLSPAMRTQQATTIADLPMQAATKKKK